MVIFTMCVLLIHTSEMHTFWNIQNVPLSQVVCWHGLEKQGAKKRAIIALHEWVVWALLGIAAQLLSQTDISSPVHVFWSLQCQNKGWIIKYFALWPCCKVCLAHSVSPQLDTLQITWCTQGGCFTSGTLGSFFSCQLRRDTFPQCISGLTSMPVTSCLTFSVHFRDRLMLGNYLLPKTAPSLHFSS